MASRRPEMHDELTLRALRLIGANPEITQRELAAELGISAGAAHYCVTALTEKGLIKLDYLWASRNRRGYVYLLTPQGLAAKAQLTVWFLRRKIVEYEALKREISALEREVDEKIQLQTQHRL